MARATTSADPTTAKLSVEEMKRGIQRIQRRLDEVTQFDPKTLDPRDPSGTVRPLSASIETALTETFGRGTIEYIRYATAARFDWPIGYMNDVQHHIKVKHVAEDRERSIQLLTAAIELLEERLEVADIGAESTKVASPAHSSNRIFIVHGHDNETKEAVARFISRLGCEPVILHEQANMGRTIIQKFQEEAADIGFAIVLMSPDDELVSGNKRARQNVILELGFFLGRLGPKNVAALVRGDVETPSDFDGVLYIKVDEGGVWRMMIAKELRAAGYEVDMNKAI